MDMVRSFFIHKVPWGSLDIHLTRFPLDQGSGVNFLDPVRALWRTHVVQESREMHFQCKPFAALPIISGVQKTKKNRQHAGSLPLGWKFAAESEVCRCSKFAAGVKLLISYL